MNTPENQIRGCPQDPGEVVPFRHAEKPFDPNLLIKKYILPSLTPSYYCLPLPELGAHVKIANLKECEGTAQQNTLGTPLSYHVIHSLLLAQLARAELNHFPPL